MNLLIITQRVDENDDLLGFFVAWVRSFARHFEHVHVITLARGSANLPSNVTLHSLGKEHQTPKFVQWVRYMVLLARLTPGSSGVFAHMSPIFAISAWPFTVLFRKRLILWYLHRSVTIRLRIAEKLCTNIVTAARESLNIQSRKIIEVGHGIDISVFASQKPKQVSDHWNILSVGRISLIKNYETLIQATQILRDAPFQVTVVGRPILASDHEYFKTLQKLVKEAGLESKVHFEGFVPYSRVSSYYRDADFSINLSPTGGIDKSVLESMAAGCIPLAANEVFRKFFGPYSDMLIFKHGDVPDLVHKIQVLITISADMRNEIQQYLRNSVQKEHDLEKTIGAIARLI